MYYIPAVVFSTACPEWSVQKPDLKTKASPLLLILTASAIRAIELRRSEFTFCVLLSQPSSLCFNIQAAVLFQSSL